MVSLSDNLTFKCMDSNWGNVSFNFNTATYFHKDYSLPVTDFQLLMTVHSVHEVPVNHLWNGAMITDHHGMIEKKKPVESDIVQSQQQQQQQLLQQQLEILLRESSNGWHSGTRDF